MRRLRWLLAPAAFAVLASACGSDRNGALDATAPSTPPVSAAASGSTPAIGPQKFGDLASPCGPGTARSASAQGVTGAKIVIGYGDDAGFASAPGLNRQLSDAIKALVKWCNEQGGINGRPIEGKYYDAKILEVNNVMLAACKEVFMLVGQGWSLDSAQEETRVGCGLGSVPAYSVSPEFAHGPFMAQPVPNPADYTPAQHAAAIARAFPDKIKKTAVMFANYAATIDTKNKALEAFGQSGFQFLNCPQQYAVGGEDDWKPFAQKLKDCGAEIVYFTGSPAPNFQNFLNAAAQLNYKPIYVTDANFYDEAFAKWNSANGGVGNNVYVRQAYVPLEEEATNPATKQYKDLVKANGGEVNQLGAQATSAFLLWATAAKACGDGLTRDCVFSEIRKITSWTGGGLHAATIPAANMPPECGLVVKLEGGSFVRFDPKEPGRFDCNKDYIKPVSGDVVKRAQLGPDRISTKYLSR